MKSSVLLIISLFVVGCASTAPNKSQLGIDKDAVRNAMRTHVPQYKECYDAEIKKNKKLEGKVVLRWMINGDGQVEEEKIQTTTLNNKKVEKCLLNVLSKTTFPKPDAGAIADVSYPLLFRSN
ncbi:hypothetical protein CIK05_02265 [Bdellovibrio sp. qaytius]|nr:hypothetical protein CIK05_02265 [Bdellovibrio sp. qaytius]